MGRLRTARCCLQSGQESSRQSIEPPPSLRNDKSNYVGAVAERIGYFKVLFSWKCSKMFDFEVRGPMKCGKGSWRSTPEALVYRVIFRKEGINDALVVAS